MKTNLFNAKSGILAVTLCFGLAGNCPCSSGHFPAKLHRDDPRAVNLSFRSTASTRRTRWGSSVNDSLNFSLNAGATYIFSVNTFGEHPMDINTAPNIDVGSRYSGASPQDINLGNEVLTIPATNYPTNLYYICQFHGFYGIITVNPPQPPPTAKILHTAVTTNIILTFSGGTNTIQLTPAV